jgi:hypothetical protein
VFLFLFGVADFISAGPLTYADIFCFRCLQALPLVERGWVEGTAGGWATP